MSLCAWITHSACRGHDMGEGHPECPERLDAISDHMLSTGLLQLLVPYDAPRATEEQLARAHTMHHVREIVANAPTTGSIHLDPDTSMGPASLEAALRAAGAAILATDLVLKGEVQRAFCAVRPPGHHATRDEAMGFCIFNNVAVGVRHALDVHGLERVVLADFDVHHGNGTEDIFAGDERVLMVSTYQEGLYPFSGESALGANMANVGLPRGSTGEQLRLAYEGLWKPRIDEFRPQMIFISAGFDAHRNDEMAGLRWVEDDYAWITARLVELAEKHCGGKIVSSLEGGYHLFHLARSVAMHVRELSGMQ